jgi:hypothetical protein
MAGNRYTEEDIVKAIERVNSQDKFQKLSTIEAAFMFNIPKSTLYNRLNKVYLQKEVDLRSNQRINESFINNQIVTSEESDITASTTAPKKASLVTPIDLTSLEKDLIDHVKSSLEESIKTFFQQLNTANNKRKRPNDDGIVLNRETSTSDEVNDRVIQLEEEKASKRRLTFSQKEKTTNPFKKFNDIKCKKCSKEFHSNMIACEKCSNWLCSETCLPKTYVQGTGLYCSRICKNLM